MRLIFLFLLLSLGDRLLAQGITTITADTVKLTGCDSSELILENHTQAVPGFLWNNGSGRTIFKRPLTKISDTFYLVGADTLKLRDPNTWLEGGNSFGKAGKFGNLDNHNIDFYTNNTFAMTLDTLGCLLLGGPPGSAGRYKLDVNGASRVANFMRVSAGTAYDINTIPVASNQFGLGSFQSVLSFANGAGIGVLFTAYGNLPANTMYIGGTSPGNWTTLVDYSTNPIFVVNGSGAITINGGYDGVQGGSTAASSNANSFDFNIYGPRGTGNGTTGDILFSTDNKLDSGVTIHPITNRWWMKGGTGNFSNTSGAASLMDVTDSSGYSQLRLRTTYTPSSSSDSNGNTGDLAWDSNYIYIKTSSGWKRGAFTTF